MTVRRDSSACLILVSLLVFAALAEASAFKAPEDLLTCLEEEEVDEQAEPLNDLIVDSVVVLEARSLNLCIFCEPAWKNSLLMYIKIIYNQ
jgi:hypothetical protein